MESGSPRVVRFGVFEADLVSGELRKSGVRVRLQEQPFQVLRALVERPGEVVTREELQSRLWSDETFVDFEDGLSTAVRKIRQALGDSASNPRFIETLPKRGYRFVYPIDGGTVSHQSTAVASSARSRRWAWPLLAAVLLAVTAVTVSLRQPELTRRTPLRPVPLTTYPGSEITPSFSPDGNQVTFAWNGPIGDDYNIYVVIVGASEPLQLTKGPGYDFAPIWSPDGRWIAFWRRHPPNRMVQLIVIPALGGRERKLTEISLPVDLDWRYCTWAPDSQNLIIPGHERDWRAGSHLTLLSLNGGEPTPLTSPQTASGAVVQDILPTVSPDGRWMAFIRVAGSVYNLYKVRFSLDGGGDPQQITTDSSAFRLGPRWSPNASEIIYYESDSPEQNGLWRVDASGEQQPEPMHVIGYQADVSAAAQRLVYESRIRRTDIWRLQLAGPRRAAGEPQRWIASTSTDTWPRYSPDGSKIVFMSSRSMHDELWLANSDGSQPSQLTSIRGGQSGTPRWSPDGRRVLFNSMMADGNREVLVMYADGGTSRRVTRHPANDYLPSWSADGSWIYFASNRSGRPEAWKIPVEGGEAVQVTHQGGSGGFESTDGFFYYVRDSSLWRVPSAGGEEAEVFESDSIGTHEWTLVKNGAYFTLRPAGSIHYFDFPSGESVEVARVGGNVGPLSVSPDGRSLLFGLSEPSESDLMLVERFD